MPNYRSGRPRVHASCTVEQINAAISEYREFLMSNGDDNLSPLLRECSDDLEEELTLRKKGQ